VQRANAEAADNLVVVTVIFLGDEFANPGQQGRDRHFDLPGACLRVLPIDPQTEKPRQHAVMPTGSFMLSPLSRLPHLGGKTASPAFGSANAS
jgi:hypothetical protein